MQGDENIYLKPNTQNRMRNPWSVMWCELFATVTPGIRLLGVDNQLEDFYKAYHAKQRGFISLNRTVAMRPFTTWDEAENDRRKNIANYNNRWNLLLLKYFKYLCGE